MVFIKVPFNYLKKNLKKYFGWKLKYNKNSLLQKIMSKKVIKLHALLFPKVSTKNV